MKFVLGRLKERQFIQNIVIMVVADLTMLSAGVIIGYYFKTMMI
ncbi:hypothetical protein [Paenibacillus xylanilyticus]|nr:hypothetical protein [Paenibacillus xylanilyticus]